MLAPAGLAAPFSTILSTPTSKSKGKANSEPINSSLHRHVTTILRLPTDEWRYPNLEEPCVPEHKSRIQGPLAQTWAKARDRATTIPPDELADWFSQNSTGF